MTNPPEKAGQVAVTGVGVRGRPPKAKAAILERLLDGLMSDDWPEVTTSRKALHVHICQLRQAGHRIDSIEAGDARGRGGGGKVPVGYRLVEQPA